MIIFSGAGSTSVSPSDIAGAWEWWEPSRETGYVNDDPMSTLAGQVAPGTGHDFTQAGALRPTFKTNILNGLAVAQFDGSDFWENVDPSALTAAHVFLVIKKTNGDTNLCFPWRFGTSASINAYPDPGSANKIFDGTCSTTRRDCGDPAPTLAAWRVVEVVSTSSEWTYLLDGTQLFTTGTNTVAIRSSCALGHWAGGGGGLVGQIAGCYFFSAKLTTDRATLITYINSRFGLSIS